jgi:hypothetical protein
MHKDRFHPKRIGDKARVLPARPTKRAECSVIDSDTAAHRYFFDRQRHVIDCNAKKAVGDFEG